MNFILKFKNSFSSKILIFFLIFSFIFIPFVSLLSFPSISYASEFAFITDIIKSVLGIYKNDTRGGVNGVFDLDQQLEPLLDSLYDRAELTVVDGEYRFSNTAMSEIYNLISSVNGFDGRVLSNFKDFENPLKYDEISRVYSKDLYDSVRFILFKIGFYGGGRRPNEDCFKIIDNDYVTSKFSSFVLPQDYALFITYGYGSKATVSLYDLNEVAYMWAPHPRDSGFYNYNGVFFNESGYAVKPLVYINPYGPWVWLPEECNNNNFNAWGYSAFQLNHSSTLFHNYYEGLPGVNLLANKSIVLSPDSSISTYRKIRDTSDYISVSYMPETFNISQDVINNNDWSKIYNDTINNINNTINNYGSDITEEDIARIIADYTNNISSAIESGVSDIENLVSTSNWYLDAIYKYLAEINKNLLELSAKVDGSGTGSGSSDIDLTELYDQLDLIKSSLSSSISSASDNVSDNIEAALAVSSDSIASAVSDSVETESAKIQGKIDCSNQLLQYVYDELVKLNKKDFGGGFTISPVVPIFDIDIDPTLDIGFDVDNNTEVDVDFKTVFRRATDNLPFTDQVLANSRLIARAMCDVAPLCYVAYIGTVISALATDPEPPDFTFTINTKPFASVGSSGGSLTSFEINEEVNLSIGDKFETLHKYLEAFLTILFVLILVIATLKLMPLILSLLGVFIPKKGGDS